MAGLVITLKVPQELNVNVIFGGGEVSKVSCFSFPPLNLDVIFPRVYGELLPVTKRLFLDSFKCFTWYVGMCLQ